eukprot:6201496-Pleurochrysis_carterae.AAC.1
MRAEAARHTNLLRQSLQPIEIEKKALELSEATCDSFRRSEDLPAKPRLSRANKAQAAKYFTKPKLRDPASVCANRESSYPQTPQKLGYTKAEIWIP